MKVSVQQALFHHFIQPVGRIAHLAAINRRTAWNHVHASAKSHVRAWNNRPAAEQDAAIQEAEQVMKGNVTLCNSITPSRNNHPVRTHRAKIPAGILHAMIDAEIDKRVQANDTFTAYSVTKLLRSMNPNNEVSHGEVQARVRYIMLAYPNYEMVYQNWNGKNARTWKPTQAPSSGVVGAVSPGAPVKIGVQHQPAQLPTGVKIADDE